MLQRFAASLAARRLPPSLRSLLGAPAFWLGSVLTLALALAATVLVFGLVHAYLLRPLPYGDAERLVVVYEHSLAGGRANTTRVTFGNVVDVVERTRSFSRFGVVRNESFTVRAPAGVEVAFIQRVSTDLFPLLGARALHGEVIHDGNADAAGQRALLLSHALWQRRFGADPSVVGSSVVLDDRGYRIVGVMPADFRLPTADEAPQGWVAMLPTDYLRDERTQRRHHLLAEVGPGRGRASADAELATLAAALASEHPATNGDRGLHLRSLREDLLGGFDRQLLLLQVAVLLVLAVACLNSGCLQLARTLARRRELAVRLALGASRRQLLAQLFAEALWIALPAAGLGCLLAAVAAPHAGSLLPPTGAVHAVPGVRVDWVLLAAAAGVALAVAFLLSLPPLVQAGRLGADEALRDRSQTGGSRTALRATRLLAIGQVAGALALLFGATLVVRSHQRLVDAELGLPVREIDQFRIGLRGDAYLEPARRVAYFEQVIERLRALPGVQAVGAINFLFVQPPTGYQGFVQEGDGLELGESPKRAVPRYVTPTLADALGLRLVSGRWFSATDTPDREAVAVISAALAERHWPGGDAIGRRIAVEGAPGDWLTVVGVVADHLGGGNQPRVVDSVYVPFAQRTPPGLGVSMVIRHGGVAPPAHLLEAALAAVDLPEMQMFQHLDLATIYARSAWQTRFVLILIAAFAGLAVSLSVAGVFAVSSFLVARRTAELGVRVALGATSRDLARQVLGSSAGLAAAGIAAGTVVAWVAGKGLQSVLYGVTLGDPASLLVSAATMLAACLLAAWLPARRAARIDPLLALRAE